MFKKYAQIDQILEVKQLPERIGFAYGEEAGNRLTRFAAATDHKEQDGYLYVRCRAISSRVNKNNDGWPAEELAKSYQSFIGKPIFVDHNNDDPQRTRGVIVDSQLHVEDAEKASAFDPYYSTAPDNHKPPTWVELLMEVDAKTFPKLANAIRTGKMDSVSMGANIEKSVCSVCANEAATPSEYCNHVKQKGVTFEITSDNGEKVRKKAYEDCYGIGFFEISNVFDPADPTADSWIDDEHKAAKLASRAEAEGLNADEVLAYAGLKRDGLLAKAASTGKPLTQEVIDKLGTDKVAFAWWFTQLTTLLSGMGLSNSIRYIANQVKERVPPQEIAEQVTEFSGAPISDQEKQQLTQFLDEIYSRGPQGDPNLSSIRFAHPAEQFITPTNPQDQSPDHERNYEPQSDMTTAPQNVDTLRSENRCPVCQAADMETDPDGIMRCPTCGHVQEPEPLDNPDLGVAHDVELRQDVTDTKTPDGDNSVPAVNPLDNVQFSPQNNVAPVAATKNSTSDEGISEMFTLKLRTSKKEEADALVPVEQKTARVELKLGENGIHRGVYDAVREAGLSVKVTYPAIDDEDNFVEVPGENGVFNLFYAQESASKLNVKVPEVPIVVEASSDEDLEKFKTILATAQRPSRTAASTDNKQKSTILPADTKVSDEPKDKVVLKDELTPRETKTLTVSDDVVELDGKKYHLTEINDSSTEDGSSDKEEEVVEDAKDEAVDDEPAAVDTEAAKNLADEVADEDDKESKLLAAFKIADLAVELGLVNSTDKMAFIAELEEESMPELAARETTMKAVKTAGLSKKNARRVDGVKRIPRLAHAVIASTNGGTPDTTPDEALFL